MPLTLAPLPDDEYDTWREGVSARRASGSRLRGLEPGQAAERTRSFLDRVLPAGGPAEGTEALAVVTHEGERRGTFLAVRVNATRVEVGDLLLDPADAAEVCGLVIDRSRAQGAVALGVGVVPDNPATAAFVAGRPFEVVATQMQLDLASPRPDGRATRVSGRPMAADEVAAYLEHAIEEFADETMAADPLLGREDALANARQVHEETLPQGAATPDHDFLAVEDAADGRRIGFLWLFHEGRMGFVYDVVVAEAERGRGYGRAVMDLAAEHCRGLGMTWLGLNVFGHNAVARSLYDSLGYEVVDQSVQLSLSPR